jgi:hypothetical protein
MGNSRFLPLDVDAPFFPFSVNHIVAPIDLVGIYLASEALGGRPGPGGAGEIEDLVRAFS